MAVRIVPADFDDPGLISLIRLHLEAMHVHSPPGSVHALDASALIAPDIDLFVASEDDVPVAMGALRDIGDGAFELKSMRTRPDRARRGLGRAMLEHLIAEAAGRGARRVSLETGSGEAFGPALALYRSRGFRNGQAFSDYVATPFNQFLHLDLEAEPMEPAR